MSDAETVAGVKVKPLEWEDHPLNGEPVLSRAITQLGTYFICDDTDDFSGYYLELISHDKAMWWQHVRSTCETLASRYHNDDLSPLKSAAQADYERRILSAIETRTPSVEEADHTAAIAERDERIAELEAALRWYGDRAEKARLIHSGGDVGRYELQADGGNRARAALSKEGE